MSELNVANKTDTQKAQSSKLFKIGLPALIVLAGLGIVGGSYFTGVHIENNQQKWITELNNYLADNKLLSELDIASEVKVTEFKRGLFSSDVKFRARLNDEMSIDGNSKVFHGPLPINSFIPALANIETQLETPARLKEIFNTNTLLQGKTNVSFAKNISGDLELAELNLNESSESVKISPVKAEYNVSPDFKDIEANVDIDRVNMRSVMGTVNLEQFKLNTDLKSAPNYKNFYLGKSNVALKNLEIRLPEGLSDVSDMKLSGIQLGGNTALNGTRQKSDMQFLINNTEVNGLTFGKLDFAAAVDLDAEIYDRLVGDMSEGKDVNTKLIEELFLKKPVLQIKKLALENKNNNAQLDMNVNLNLDSIPQKAPSEEEVLKALSGSHFGFSVDRDYLVEAIKLFAMLNGEDSTAASNGATQAVRLLFAGAESADKFFNVKDNKLAFKLELNQRDVSVNGVKLSEKDRLTAQQIMTNPESLFNGFDVMNWSSNFDLDTLDNILQQANVKEVTSNTQVVQQSQVREETTVPKEIQQEAAKPVIVATSNLDPACQLQSGMDDISFLQACLKTSPNEEQIQEIIAQAKNLGVCNVAQRLYANKGQSNPTIALAYAKEYDPQFAGSNICFNANKNTAVYWYETVMEMEPGNSEARMRLMELKK